MKKLKKLVPPTQPLVAHTTMVKKTIRDKVFITDKEPIITRPNLASFRFGSDIDLNKLGDLMLQYSAWIEYARNEHISALIAFKSNKSVYDAKYRRAFLSDKSKTKYEKDLKVQELLADDLADLEQSEILMEALSHQITALETTYTFLSREVSRRSLLK